MSVMIYMSIEVDDNGEVTPSVGVYSGPVPWREGAMLTHPHLDTVRHAVNVSKLVLDFADNIRCVPMEDET